MVELAVDVRFRGSIIGRARARVRAQASAHPMRV